jgi:SAM-dependent methyltransferase
MQQLWEQSDADYHAQILQLTPHAQSMLDVGCDDGAWTAEVARAAGAGHVAGIEVQEGPREQARARGFDVRLGDIEDAWPFADGEFDLVHANQVIEHVKRLDHFVGETRRVLRPGGTALICTENLASWHNVAAAALGWMPFSLTNISNLGTVGNPIALHQDDVGAESWQHVHVLTMDALVSIFELHGFQVVQRFGAGYYPAFGRAGRWLARRDVRHAHFIGVLATKPAL